MSEAERHEDTERLDWVLANCVVTMPTETLDTREIIDDARGVGQEPPPEPASATEEPPT